MSVGAGSPGLPHTPGIREKSDFRDDGSWPAATIGGSNDIALRASLPIPDQAVSPESVLHHPLLTPPL